jgi:hypothetical protein
MGKEKTMKPLVAFLFALALGAGFTTPTFANDPTKAKTKIDCQRAGGMWDVETNACLRGLASASR